jgi:c-di-GMP-binding flagellar brake protein YcgR
MRIREEHVTTLTVRKPPVDIEERRKTRRYPLSFPVVVAAGQQSLKATSRDVSTGGVYLLVGSEENLQPGTELDLTLMLQQEVTSEEEVLVRAHGKTVRVETSNENGTGDTGVAVVFETHHFLRSNSLYG